MNIAAVATNLSEFVTLSKTKTEDQATTMFPNMMAFFALLWACQDLIHMLYYVDNWRDHGNPMAWAVIILSLLTIIFPHVLLLFAALLVSTIIYNIGEMPYVVNHILVEVLLSATILLAIITAAVSRHLGNETDSREWRDAIFYRFAPVIGGVLILTYHIIFVSKLNWGFYDPEINCIAPMYDRVVDRMAFLVDLPSTTWILVACYWVFMAVEVILPLLLGFKRTAYAMFFVGLPFHLMLGLIGHWTFSGFVLVVYAVIAFPSIMAWLDALKQKLGSQKIDRIKWGLRGVVISLALFISIAVFTGNYEGDGPFFIEFRFTYMLWIIWYVAFSAVIFAAIFRQYKLRDSEPLSLWSSAPKWLWICYGLVLINGFSPYLGFKTETSVAMYSNMRTEGGANNHMFMPALRLLPDNDRLVEVIASNDAEISAMKTTMSWSDKEKIQRPIYNTYFEFRRAVSQSTNPNLTVTYKLEGKEYTHVRGDSKNVDKDLDTPYSWLARKLIFFRPVFQGEKSYCLH